MISAHARTWILSLLVFITMMTPTVAAQESTPAAPVAAHWQTEPARVGQANAVVVTLADGTATADLAALSYTIVHGGQPTALTVSVDTQGQALAAFTPQEAGAYALRIDGTLNGAPVQTEVALTDVQAVTLGLPAIQSDAPGPDTEGAVTGPNWAVIGGGILIAGVLLVAAVLVGRPKR